MLWYFWYPRRLWFYEKSNEDQIIEHEKIQNKKQGSCAASKYEKMDDWWYLRFNYIRIWIFSHLT